MVAEVQFYKREADAFLFDRQLIDQVAFPVGDRYPQEIFDRYFADYGGMVQKFKPKRILEIGVRYGYTAICFCLAAKAAGIERPVYVGVDDESYPPAPGVNVGSCAKANDNFTIAVPFADARAIRWNSFSGIPATLGTFDLIHVDGNHDTHGVLNDLGHCWPILNIGGFILLDDYYMLPIQKAIHQWLEGFVENDEVVAVQFVENERGHCYLRKTGIQASQLADATEKEKKRIIAALETALIGEELC